MKNDTNTPRGKVLRQRAEKRLLANKPEDVPLSPDTDVRKLIHVLQVQQAELEIQNEELHRAMKELAASADKYIDFYEFTPVGYLTLDEQGRIRESNLTAATLLGMERSLLMGKPLELIIRPESLPVFRLFLKNIYSERSKQTCELRLMKNGAEERFIYVEGMAHQGNTPDETARQCRTVIIDITKRKQAEKELESFSYSVSHDLREPIRAIDGYSRMLLKDLQDKLDDESRRKFAVIREKTARMDHLITDVLEFSRLGRQKLSLTVIPEQMVTEVWQELLETHAEREITMKISPLPACYGDERLIRQVFTNLIANAVKFTQGKQAVTIEVGGQETAEECVYYVRDNGIGFDMGYADKLFHMFRRLHTDEEYEGTGVGLAIVKRIVGLHGGRVWAEGQPGEGATFYFSLPKHHTAS